MHYAASVKRNVTNRCSNRCRMWAKYNANIGVSGKNNTYCKLASNTLQQFVAD